MEDMFDVAADLAEFCGPDEDSMLSEFDIGSEPQMRSRAYTWPTRPVAASLVDDPANSSATASPEVVTLAAPQLLLTDDGERGSHGELQLSPGGGVTSSRKTASRRNAWGNMSYADLITKAIDSSPDKRLTLSQIYAWMVANVPFFSDKGDSNSSAGWKNSIRHNLSLHNRFMRVQNEGTGKSSWWMVNPEAVSRVPRKRAGTMDSTIARRPTKPNKRPPSGLKHARSTELHSSPGADIFDPSSAARSPSVVGNERSGFESPRVRASSGNSSTSGCSPAALTTPLESTDINPCFTLPPSTWDVLYPPKQETLSESLADIFISDATGGGPATGGTVCSESASTPMFGSPHGLQPMFMSNEAYAHGMPIHQPTSQHFVPQTSVGCNVASGYSVPPNSAFQTNGGQVFGCNGGSKSERVPTLGELLQEQYSGSGYLLNTFLTSGGSVTSQQQNWSAGDPLGMSTEPQPTLGSASSPRRPLQINQRLLMQLLATKPHLARRLQQLIEAKRRQLSAMQQQSPVYPQMMPQQLSVPDTQPTAANPAMSNATTMLQQLLTGGSAGPQSAAGITSPLAATDAGDNTFPSDLDMSLLDLQSTSDINCDIEQVIRHELSFGDKLDFSFDQLHLDEFDADFAS